VHASFALGFAYLAGLVLGDLVLGVLLAVPALAVGATSLGNVHLGEVSQHIVVLSVYAIPVPMVVSSLAFAAQLFARIPMQRISRHPSFSKCLPSDIFSITQAIVLRLIQTTDRSLSFCDR
jgi:hypothetical protein